MRPNSTILAEGNPHVSRIHQFVLEEMRDSDPPTRGPDDRNGWALLNRLTRFVRRLVLWYSIRNRQRKAQHIAAWMRAHQCSTVLFVGVMGTEFTGNSSMSNAGIVERHLASEFDVKMGINVEPAITPYPFQIADARDLPFENDYVDFAMANAIIEHVGDSADQARMVAEMTRVAHCWVITTPNRWFPIESHTSAVLAHWSAQWRGKQKSFTRLLSLREFRSLLPEP